jgi:hypothetical protein
MVLKIVCCFVILSFRKRFLRESLDVMMISLFFSLGESLGINIMFVVLLLNGGEWCASCGAWEECDYKGYAGLKAKYSGWFCVIWHCRDCIQNG